MEKEYYVPGLYIELSKKGTKTQLNRLFVVGGLKGILEVQIRKKVDKIFPFLAGFIFRCSGWVEETSLSKVHVLYSELLLSMTKVEISEGLNENRLTELQRKREEFKKLLLRKFSAYCSSGLYTPKFHLLDHVGEDLEVFETLSVLDASPFEQNNVNKKQTYR